MHVKVGNKGWHRVRGVIYSDTGHPLTGVIEVDTDQGWVLRYQRRPDGVFDMDMIIKEIGNFEVMVELFGGPGDGFVVSHSTPTMELPVPGVSESKEYVETIALYEFDEENFRYRWTGMAAGPTAAGREGP